MGRSLNDSGPWAGQSWLPVLNCRELKGRVVVTTLPDVHLSLRSFSIGRLWLGFGETLLGVGRRSGGGRDEESGGQWTPSRAWQ